MEKKGTPLTFENTRSCTMNGQAIRSRGIQLFVDNCSTIPTSNIDFFASRETLEKRWRACEGGCHTPSYRVLHRQSNYTEIMTSIENIDPTKGLATGVLDGVIRTTEYTAKGVQRTGEGLGFAGEKRIGEIGTENSLAFNLAKDVLSKGFSLSLSLIDNPFTAMIIKIITYYMKFVPEEIIVELAIHGKLKFPSGDIDANLVIQGSMKGLTEIDLKGMAISELKDIASLLENNPRMLNRFIGKQIGNKLATYIATIIAIAIAKQVAARFARTMGYRNTLKQITSGKSAKGGLAGVLVFLLKTQGMLQVASEASSRLHNKSQLLWQSLRQMNGLDLLYFFVEDLLFEHVDRISFGEKHPTSFIKMVEAILEGGSADDLFFPFGKP